MNRFFLPPEAIQAGQVIFPGEVSRQITRVLRLKPGDVVTVLDNLGSEYRVELVSVAADGARGMVQERSEAKGEPPLRLALYLCLTQREKFEWILQKCTETGVAEFTPVISSRSLVQDTTRAEKKLERWRRIVREAAEQSGRGRIPGINATVPFAQALRQGVTAHQAALLGWEEEQHAGLGTILTEIGSLEQLALLIGPEGGLSQAEVQAAVDLGWRPFSLGRRIFRMETAAVVASARLIAAAEDPPG
jgi:16S rRNA (uracil1498-N3)-methyltransferase